MQNSTIVALSTAVGGALSVIRLSGDRAREIVQCYFSTHITKPRYAYFGTIAGLDGRAIDEVVVVWFKAPHSYTGEDTVEISCHGSSYVSRSLVELMLSGGASQAAAGEFTLRAFLAGKLDLSQAEAVADLIASDSAASHRVAMNQMRGGYSVELAILREKLLNITSLLELELDFSEEDVEFADRSKLVALLTTIQCRVGELSASFRLGNVLKNGVPVSIVGRPNSGKSTLLNTLLGEERAIVSDIAGTTRDFIEECVSIGGVTFRFIDTAGLRHTLDEIEALGIERTRERITRSELVLLLVDMSDSISVEVVLSQLRELALNSDQRVVVVLNKCDKVSVSTVEALAMALTVAGVAALAISAKSSEGVDSLRSMLVSLVGVDTTSEDSVIVSNIRHLEALTLVSSAISAAICALSTNLSADLVSEDIRIVLYHLGSITGEITTDDVLGNIFSKFCIGK